MLKVNAALLRCFRDWRRLLIGSVLAPIPGVNLIVTGYAIRAGVSFTEKPYQLPSWRPLGPLVRDGVLVLLLTLAAMVPLLIITQVLIAAQNVVSGRTLWLIPFTYLVLISYVLPAIIAVYGRAGSLAAALDAPAIYYSVTTATYLKVWLAATIGALLIFGAGLLLTVLTAPTILLPFLVVGASSFVAQCFFLALFADLFRT